MIIKPLSGKRSPERHWAIITKAGVHGIEMIDCDGNMYRRRRGEHSRRAIAEIKGLVFSAVKPTSILIGTDARYWSASSWQGAISNLKMDGGPKVIPLRKVFDDASPYEMVEALTQIAEIANAKGVPLGSFSSLAWGLWRSTLHSSVTIYGPGIRDSLHGGRKESLIPGEYKRVAYWDINAAYPNAQSSEPFPIRLKRVSASSSIAEGIGIAFAQVKIPRLEWGPLPVKVGNNATCYGWGSAEGWWTWRDLRAAKDAGCDVTILDSFAGFHYQDLFGPWWTEFKPMRQLPGHAGRMAKAITSTLWGQFAMSESTSEIIRWVDEWGRKRITVPEIPRDMPHKWIVHIAAETTSRVREKLWNEGLSLPGSIYCDTDSVMTGESVSPSGHGWSTKKEMFQVDIRGPQTYRYRCGMSCGENHPNWHYVVGGISSPEAAERVFRREHRRHAINISMGFDGLSLPAMNIDKAKEIVGG